MTDPVSARERAREILGEQRFKEPDAPRPLRRPLTWLGRRIDELFGPIWSPISRQGWLLVIIAVVVLVAFVVWLSTLGRTRIQQVADRRLLDAGPDVDPAELERAAERARAAGDHQLAVRLRFKAGLVRLERAGRIGTSEDRTNGDVRRQLGSPTFSALADRFDEVVYGDDEATADDDDRARDGWADLLSGSRS